MRVCSPGLVHNNNKAHLEYSEKQELQYRHPYEMSEEDLKSKYGHGCDEKNDITAARYQQIEKLDCR